MVNRDYFVFKFGAAYHITGDGAEVMPEEFVLRNTPQQIQQIYSNYTASWGDYIEIWGSNSLTVTLPAGTDADIGKVIVIKNATDNQIAITVNSFDGKAIDGLTSTTISGAFAMRSFLYV